MHWHLLQQSQLRMLLSIRGTDVIACFAACLANKLVCMITSFRTLIPDFYNFTISLACPPHRAFKSHNVFVYMSGKRS